MQIRYHTSKGSVYIHTLGGDQDYWVKEDTDGAIHPLAEGLSFGLALYPLALGIGILVGGYRETGGYTERGGVYGEGGGIRADRGYTAGGGPGNRERLRNSRTPRFQDYPVTWGRLRQIIVHECHFHCISGWSSRRFR